VGGKKNQGGEGRSGCNGIGMEGVGLGWAEVGRPLKNHWKRWRTQKPRGIVRLPLTNMGPRSSSKGICQEEKDVRLKGSLREENNPGEAKSRTWPEWEKGKEEKKSPTPERHRTKKLHCCVRVSANAWKKVNISRKVRDARNSR